MYVMYIREYIYYLVSLVFISLFKEDVLLAGWSKTSDLERLGLATSHGQFGAGNKHDYKQTIAYIGSHDLRFSILRSQALLLQRGLIFNFDQIERLLSSVRYEPEVYVILMNTMPLGGPKRKIFAFEMSPARVKSGDWGQRKPDYKNLKRWEVDMEILRGPENLGAPWDSMGRFPGADGIIWTIGALMKWVCSTLRPYILPP
jgi:hypothetical protein